MNNEVQNSRDPLTEKVIGCAIEVHRILGPGLLESAKSLNTLQREAAEKLLSSRDFCSLDNG